MIDRFLSIIRQCFESADTTYFLGIVPTLIIGYVLYRQNSKNNNTRKSFKDFIAFVFPKFIYSHRSTWIDFASFFLNPIIASTLLLPFILNSYWLRNQINEALYKNLGPTTPLLAFGNSWMHTIILTLIIFITIDFVSYINHYLMHKSKYLWPFHEVHHSAQVLTPLTTYRAHPVEYLLENTIISMVTGFIYGIHDYLFVVETPLALILNVNIFLVFFHFTTAQLRHSHLWVTYPDWLSRILISPAQHQIHHSRDVQHFDKNLGSLLSIWDSIFGTIYLPKKKLELQVGLSPERSERYKTLLSLYIEPFLSIFQLMKQKAKNRIAASVRKKAEFIRPLNS